MMRFIEHYFSHADNRGRIDGLINTGLWEEVNLIQTQADTVRGNHYHQATKELFVILEGKIRVAVQQVNQGRLVGMPEEHTVAAGDVFLIEPWVNHTFHVVQDAKWLNLLSRKTDQKNPDIHRIEK